MTQTTNPPLVDDKNPVQELIFALGGPTELSEYVDMTVAAVSQWGLRGKIPPAWLKVLRTRYNRKPEHKLAWASFDAAMAARSSSPEGDGV